MDLEIYKKSWVTSAIENLFIIDFLNLINLLNLMKKNKEEYKKTKELRKRK